ncbi:f-box domain [Lecanosticta acicola]|uniref:F-box domain n=1 Tax=Lecanosticta acicola TaxID=111012 RepID=A0AAI8Z123_9PEZI|nr:f-box domain [Lecanosticta acicola]
MDSNQRDAAQGSQASVRVLELYELAETILLYLPLQDLLLANRVCKTWHDVMERSDKINKVLFKQPMDDRRISYPHETFKLAPGMTQPSWRTKDTPDSGVAYPAINPFIAKSIREGPYYGTSIHSFLVKVCPRDGQACATLRWGDGGSWATMLLTQPPAKKLFYQCRASRMWSPNYILGTFSADSIWPPDSRRGVELGEIAESLKTHMGKCPECPNDLPKMTTCFHGVRHTQAVQASITTGWEMLALLEWRT